MNGKDYRAAVGPRNNYDIIGGLQFSILLALGLREHHILLDIGCGSLRGGRLFIPYLRKKHYYGIEPAEWLINASIDNEIGADVVMLKEPTFHVSGDFDFDHFGIKFDYILAQSILTHTSRQLMWKCINNVRGVLKYGGIFAFTIMPGDNYEGPEGWIANGNVASYHPDYVCRILKNMGLSYIHVPWPHPSGQMWFVASANASVLVNMKAHLPVWQKGKLYGMA